MIWSAFTQYSLSDAPTLNSYKNLTAEIPEDLIGLASELGTTVIRQLSISARIQGGSKISMELGAGLFGQRLQGYGDDDICHATVAQIADVLRARRRTVVSRLIAAQMPFFLILGSFAVGSASTVGVLFSGAFEAGSWAGLIVALIVSLASIALVQKACSWAADTMIHLHKRSEHEPLFTWADYKTVIVGFVSAVVTGLGVLTVQYLTGWSIK